MTASGHLAGHNQPPSAAPEAASTSARRQRSLRSQSSFPTPPPMSSPASTGVHDAHPHSDPLTPSKGKVPRRPSLVNQRTRSDASSRLLGRFTSRSSIISFDSPSLAESDRSELSGKLDRGALTKPRGKYKSGVNWDNSVFFPSHGTEAYLDVGSPAQSPEEAPPTPMEEQQRREMLAVGGTAAAAAYYRGLGTGDTVFPAQQRALLEASMRAAMVSQATSPRLAGGTSPVVGSRSGVSSPRIPGSQLQSHSPSPQMSFRTTPQPAQPHASTSAPLNTSRAGLGPPSLAVPSDSVSVQSQTSSNDRFLSPSSRSGDKLSPTSTSEDPNLSSDKSPAPSLRATGGGGGKMRGLFGFKSKPSNGQLQKGKAAQREGISASPSLEGSSGDDRPRRRFPNTRELDIVATELANDAAIETYGMPTFGPHATWGPSPSISGSRTPVDKRGSGQLGFNGGGGSLSGSYNFASLAGSPHSSPSSLSLASNGNGFQSFMPPFARQDHVASPSSSIPSSPLSGSTPDLGPTGKQPFIGKPSTLGTAPVSQKILADAMPTEMFTGLGDGPYPLLPPPPPGSQLFNDSASDASGFSSGTGTPRRIPASGVGTASPAAALAPPQQGSRKGSVLSMTMHDPQADMQGLIQKTNTKSGRNTPWGSRAGSRAPSRTVTPKTSAKNLNELAKQQSTQLQARLSALPAANGWSNGNVNGSGSSNGNGLGPLGRKISPDRVFGMGAAVPTPVAEEAAFLDATRVSPAEDRGYMGEQDLVYSLGNWGSGLPPPEPVDAGSLAVPPPVSSLREAPAGSKKKGRMSVFSAFTRSKDVPSAGSTNKEQGHGYEKQNDSQMISTSTARSRENARPNGLPTAAPTTGTSELRSRSPPPTLPMHPPTSSLTLSSLPFSTSNTTITSAPSSKSSIVNHMPPSLPSKTTLPAHLKNRRPKNPPALSVKNGARPGTSRSTSENSIGPAASSLPSPRVQNYQNPPGGNAAAGGGDSGGSGGVGIRHANTNTNGRGPASVWNSSSSSSERRSTGMANGMGEEASGGFRRLFSKFSTSSPAGGAGGGGGGGEDANGTTSGTGTGSGNGAGSGRTPLRA